MSYAQYSTVVASDLNTFIGTNPTTAANTLNTIWATGGGAAGYGASAAPRVSTGGEVYAVNWSNLVTTTTNIARHQGSSITTVSIPANGNVVQYISAIPTNLSTIYTNRLNAASQGANIANTVTIGSSWSSRVTFTFTAAFANGDAARYFFNAGGQFKFQFAQPTGSTISDVFNALAIASGTIVMSAPATGTATIVGTSYNGITKIGGSGSATLATNSGYYGLATSNTTLFSQTTTTAPSGYNSSSISLLGKTNGTQGTNADNGNIITFYSIWQEAPNTDLIVSTGGNATITAIYPEQGNIANTWGTVTLAGSVNITPITQVTVPDVRNLTQNAANIAIVNASLTVGTATTASSGTIVTGNVVSQLPTASTSVNIGTPVNLVISTGPAQVPVPDIYNITTASANTRIQGAGLVVGTTSGTTDQNIASGNVITGTPAAGTIVLVGTQVNYVYSTGKPNVLVPNVVNSTQSAANTTLENFNLTHTGATSSTDQNIASGNVISQNPIDGTSVAQGTNVLLVISSGKPNVLVPDIYNIRAASANTRITSNNLVIGTVTNSSDPTIVSGNVISQTPRAGTSVAQQTPVNYVKSTGPATYSVGYLVVAGGGGGGSGYGGTGCAGGGGGGGGAGGLQCGNVTLAIGTQYTISVGAGGPANTSGGTSNISGGIISTIATCGGGHGAACRRATAGNGGSGGGATSGNLNGSCGRGYKANGLGDDHC